MHSQNHQHSRTLENAKITYLSSGIVSRNLRIVELRTRAQKNCIVMLMLCKWAAEKIIKKIIHPKFSRKSSCEK